jgi:hypothetical protein
VLWTAILRRAVEDRADSAAFFAQIVKKTVKDEGNSFFSHAPIHATVQFCCPNTAAEKNIELNNAKKPSTEQAGLC